MEKINISDEKSAEISQVIDSMFLEIEKKVISNLENGGDGCTERVINGAKFGVDEILDGFPLRLFDNLYHK